MTLNKRSLRQWEEDAHVLLTSEQKAMILNMLGSDPGDGNSWSEQDIAETIRKIRRDYPAPEKHLPDFVKQEC